MNAWMNWMHELFEKLIRINYIASNYIILQEFYTINYTYKNYYKQLLHELTTNCPTSSQRSPPTSCQQSASPTVVSDSTAASSPPAVSDSTEPSSSTSTAAPQQPAPAAYIQSPRQRFFKVRTMVQIIALKLCENSMKYWFCINHSLQRLENLLWVDTKIMNFFSKNV